MQPVREHAAATRHRSGRVQLRDGDPFRFDDVIGLVDIASHPGWNRGAEYGLDMAVMLGRKDAAVLHSVRTMAQCPVLVFRANAPLSRRPHAQQGLAEIITGV